MKLFLNINWVTRVLETFVETGFVFAGLEVFMLFFFSFFKDFP